ncbi:acyl transferase [Roseivirga sp. UBA838]|uniref:LuxE/PaaK family acyltransferase n=1 Tax=Roseivirga sp. UBA838 TaxID=1947393 RepID=UPI002580F387|nr:acyl transferase [Roseivirga sp. UBA838]|tara:strand:- start:5569 stop:6558 length:990 start_codon:yes stop_codon:yes gene_type:complete
MAEINSLIHRIKSVSEEEFNALALDVYRFQYRYNKVYRAWCDHLKRSPQHVSRLEEVPFLPISFFKAFEIKTGQWQAASVFESSGTTGTQPSRHFVADNQLYLDNCKKAFEAIYGPLNDYVILALLPSYLERGNSGLVAMVNRFIECTNDTQSGFYLNNLEQLAHQLQTLKKGTKKVLLWGVTFALLDFAEQYSMHFPELLVMETGGMKGRREELVREEVHDRIKRAFGVKEVHSEYGMTELFSQGYSTGNGLFRPSETLKVVGRELNDPLSYPSFQHTVAFNIVDLANVHTCSFIETKDIGRVLPDGRFEVKGRMDNSDLRGCNLMVV